MEVKSLIDYGTSQEAFEKVRDGLKNYVGYPVLVIKPEVGSSLCSGDGVSESYSDVGRLGFLHGAPSLDKDSLGIVLPMAAHVVDPMGIGRLSREVSLISFNCMNPDRISINSHGSPKGDINIYSGNDAVENVFGEFYSSNYTRSCNLLGITLKDTNFFDVHSEKISTERTEALGNANRLLKESFHSSSRDFKELTSLVLEWDMKDGEMRLPLGVKVNLREYLSI